MKFLTIYKGNTPRISDTKLPSLNISEPTPFKVPTKLESLETYWTGLYSSIVTSLDLYLLKSQNLNDLPDKPIARTNLGVPAGSGTSTGTNTGDQTITLTGDVTGSGIGSFAATIAANAVDTAEIVNNAVIDAKLRDSAALSVIGRSANSSGDPADISTTAASAAVLRESGSIIGFGTVATAGIAANAVTHAKMQTITSGRLLGSDGAGGGDITEIIIGSALSLPDATLNVALSGIGTTLIANDAVSNAKLRNSAALSVIGRAANSTGDPADIAASAASGAVLRESGSTVGFGTVATAGIADDAVTYAKLQNVSATDKVLGRSTVGAGDTEEIACTAAGRTMIAAANATAQLAIVTPLTTRGDIVVRDASATTRLGIGADNKVLSSDGTDPSWADPAIPISLVTTTTTAIAAGSVVFGIMGSGQKCSKFNVPTGKVLKILCASGGYDTGAGVGTWTITFRARKTDSTETTLATFTQTVASATYNGSATGTMDSPLVSYAAGEEVQIGWGNDASSPGPTGVLFKTVMAFGYLVPV